MCDYSLMAIPSRLAVPGDDLVIHRFEAGALGMAAAFDIQARRDTPKKQGFWPRLKEFFKQDPEIPAVCIPPGSHLIVRDIPQSLQRKCGLTNHMGEAVFTQLTVEEGAFRDAVRFNNGTEVLLQRFAEGQRVKCFFRRGRNSARASWHCPANGIKVCCFCSSSPRFNLCFA